MWQAPWYVAARMDVDIAWEVLVGSRGSGWPAIARRTLQIRAIRFAIVGGAGIPINMAFLWFFHSLLGMPMIPAWTFAFVCSALINFYGNQKFTYHEQKHLRGWDWPIRAAKAQLSSLAGLIVNVGAFSLLMHAGMHYLPADAAGIVAAFSVNFIVSKHFVFRPALRNPRSECPSSESALAEAEGVA
jgi:putative flippase GtrA